MRFILHILSRLWVQQFYLRNAGFFLFLFVVLFGVVQNPLAYHHQLMRGIVSAYTTMTIAMVAWLLYACKCAAIVVKSIVKEKAWLCQLQAITPTQLCFLLLAAHALLFLPATIYIIVTICVGVYTQQYLAAVTLILFLLFIHIASAAVYYHALFSNGKQVRLLNKPLFKYQLPKTFFSFLLWYNLYTGKLKTIAVKFFSFILLFIPLVWNSDHFELSDFVLFFQVSIAAHAVVVYDSAQFLEHNFRVLRNIPMPLYKLFVLFVFTYIILLLPEVFFLWYYGSKVQLEVSIFSLQIYYLGQLLLYTALVYERHQKIENYLLYIGLITVCSLMLTPFKSFGFLGGALIIIAFTLFSSNYYRYEQEYEHAGKDINKK